MRSTSLDAVSHALSHSVLFNEFEFHFCSKILIFPSFNLIHIATRLLNHNFKIFQKPMCQWIARIFLHRLVYPEKKQPKICGEKIQKTRCSYNFIQEKMTTFFWKFSLMIIMWYSNIFVVYSERASRNIYLRVNNNRICSLQREQ